MISPIRKELQRLAVWLFSNKVCRRRSIIGGSIFAQCSGPDDFASMEEVLMRRLNRWKAAQDSEQAPGNKLDPSFAILPDLIIVDGGKGQLGRAVTVLEKFGLLGKVPVTGLAKQNEELFVPGRVGIDRITEAFPGFVPDPTHSR